MPSTIDQEKKALRSRVRQQLAGLAPEQTRAEDEVMFDRFLSLPQVKDARAIFAFWGIPGREPETALLIPRLLAMGKQVGLPRMLPQHRMEARLYDPAIPLRPVSFGIQEPGEDCPLLEKSDINLVLVPAVCYDRRGYRLGFGGGYYDRWLADFHGPRVGLCRAATLQEQVPIEAHDARVDVLIAGPDCLSL